MINWLHHQPKLEPTKRIFGFFQIQVGTLFYTYKGLKFSRLAVVTYYGTVSSASVAYGKKHALSEHPSRAQDMDISPFRS
jgi:hypothetical protein